MTTEQVQSKEFRTQGITVDPIDHKTGLPFDKPVLVFPKGTFRNHGTYPVRLSVSKETADTVKPDVVYRGTIERGEAKIANPRYDTEYYWHVLEIVPVKDEAPAAASPATPTPVSAGTQQARPGPVGPQAASPPWPVEQEGTRGGRDKSIEWQVALKAAVEALEYMKLDEVQKTPKELVKVILATTHALFNREVRKPGPAQAPPATPAGQGQPKASQRKGTQAPAEDDPDTLPY